MSDAASQAELDDVLSSIRKLVTESNRAQTASSAAPVVPKVEEPTTFVLGTDWRVRETEDDADLASEGDEADRPVTPETGGSIFRGTAANAPLEDVEEESVSAPQPRAEASQTSQPHLGDLARSELERAIAELETLVSDVGEVDTPKRDVRAADDPEVAEDVEAPVVDGPERPDLFDPTADDDVTVDHALVAHHAAADVPNQVHDAELVAQPGLTLDDAALDEGALREMVAEIVREEL
ncbi:MAG: hypothetical protein ACU0DW_02735, partial [Shimia sp.]